MDKETYWKQKNARLRLQKMARLERENSGTHRICWMPAETEDGKEPKERQGGWVYDNAEEAQEDAARFEKMPFCARAWVEVRVINATKS